MFLFALLSGCNENATDREYEEVIENNNGIETRIPYNANSSTNDTGRFIVVEIQQDTSPTTKLAVQACAGLYNHQRGGSVYTHMSDKDSQWLHELQLRPVETVDASTFLESCINDFPKYVKYSYINQQKLLPNILTVGAVLEAVPLDEKMDFKSNNVVFDATTEFAELNTPYLATEYVYNKYVEKTKGLAMLNPGYCTQGCDVWDPPIVGDMNPYLIDFVFSEKLFVIFLVNGCTSLSKENELLNKIAGTNPWTKPIGVYGYNNSWMLFGGYAYESQTKCVTSRNMGAIPTEVTNLSFFSSRREPISSAEELKQNKLEGIVYNPNETFVAFVVGDGDNVAYIMDARRNWLSERLDDCKKVDNSCEPITWTISPHLPRIAPEVLNWYYETSRNTGNDYFMLPPSGYLYAYPGALTEQAQDNFVSYTEQAARILGTNSTMNWEWFDSWKNAESHFLPKYAKKEGAIRGLFPVNVPYMFPTTTWAPLQFYKILTGKDGAQIALFAPRSWRGVDNSGNTFTKKFYLSPDKMANELGEYPRGTVAYVYLTSDGGLTLSNSFMKLVKLLPKHVHLVSADTATRLALEAQNNTWGTPISFKTAHNTYLTAEGNGGGTVNANRNTIGAWERFHFISEGPLKDGTEVSIQTGNGSYFSAQQKGGLDANRTAVGPWERFILINRTSPGGLLRQGDRIALKTAHNTYVVAENNGQANANRGGIGSWETFTVIFH